MQEMFREYPDPFPAFQYLGGPTYGGELLESALAQPQAGFQGRYLYKTIFDKAAALMFSLVKNHPLVDGNKRLALATTQVFLAVNGYSIKAPQKERVKLALGVAKGERGRKAVARWLRRYALKIPDGYLR